MLRNVKTVFEKSQPQAQMGKVFNGTQKIGPLQYLRSALILVKVHPIFILWIFNVQL